MSQLNLDRISYHEDQRYMEDYFLTLQIFTKESADWDSLTENSYIGDYIHSIDQAHTLAFTNETERQMILVDPEYVVCEERINEMRRSLIKRRQLFARQLS